MQETSLISTFKDTLLKIINKGTYDGQYFYFYDQKYHLEFEEGTYERSPALLIHHILFYEDIYHLFCDAPEIKTISEQIHDDVIFRSEKHMDLLDDLHSAGKEIILTYKGQF